MLTAAQIKAIKTAGFKILDPESAVEGDDLNGVILKDGTMILCKGFNEHRYVYPLLKSLDLVDNADWIHEESAIHVSSNQLNGYVAFDLDNSPNDCVATEAQIHTLFTLRNVIDGCYGENDKIAFMLYNYICAKEKHGGKYNGLVFLKHFYKDIRLPEFSKNFNGIKHNVCIRTSPIHSLPGLLNSKFDVTATNYKKLVYDIGEEFKRYADIVEGNEINWFFQQKLDGINGVCNVRGRDRTFTYDASVGQGDVVQGKKGNIVLNQQVENELKTIATTLAKEFNRSIQLEFVVSGKMLNELYIVQFRLLKNEPQETVQRNKPSTVICTGKTFSRGEINVDVKDILVVNEDGDSNLLLGKKALIVKKNVEFSHLLALSKTLGIPSMYATGKVDFGKRKKVEFVAYNKKSWIV